MHTQKAIDYLKVHFPDMLNNETIDRTELLTMLIDFYEWGCDDSKSDNYDEGYEEGYDIGFDEGYKECLRDHDIDD